MQHLLLPDWQQKAVHVEQIQYIQRGYENFEEKIRSLGGIIERVDVEDRTDRDRMMRKMSLAAY